MKKRTLQEIADFFGLPVAVMSGRDHVLVFSGKPHMNDLGTSWRLKDVLLTIPLNIDIIELDYTGDWNDSLTMPSEPPFKVGEVAVDMTRGFVFVVGEVRHGNLYYRDYFSDNTGCLSVSKCRRPTEEEWKVLRGESLTMPKESE